MDILVVVAVCYFSACTVLAINVLKYYYDSFRWNFVWTRGQKASVIITTAICCYIIPARVYFDTFGKNK
ncbi:hypothetical protein Aes012_127 [Aeromonas phage Aes012]|uniref:Putative phage protein n=1 Tax=Aeromonas phage Aes012 TaxID=1198014 RepID=I6ZRF1_9CAUD|nr:hypothetical protein Aes012_127 [Aeromonas phage Aes012]AFN69757.1 putative phage protein [Aeromonas phage Aes012]